MQPTLTHYIEFRQNHDGEFRAFISGTRVRVQDVYVESEIHGKSPDEIVSSLPHLTLAQVHAALSHYFDHREQILDEMRRDKRFVVAFQQTVGPGPLEQKRSATDIADDAVSS